MKLKLLWNPTAGRGKVLRHIGEVVECLRSRATVEVYETKSAADLTRAAAEASRSDYDRVVVAGGDGTVHFAVRDFDLQRGTLAVVPLGSGDDFARVAGIPHEQRQACRTVLEGSVREIDVATANGTRYVGVAGLGFDSEVAAYANQNVRFLRGSAVYLYAIFKVLPRFEPHPVTFHTGNAIRNEQIMFACVGNTRQYGAGIRIVPAAIIDDGELDYCVVHRTTKLQLLKTLPRAYNGSHVRKSFVETGRGKEFRFDSDERLEVYADGEKVTETPVVFRLAAEKLKVVVPRA